MMKNDAQPKWTLKSKKYVKIQKNETVKSKKKTVKSKKDIKIKALYLFC
jgi:hypothetical protein